MADNVRTEEIQDLEPERDIYEEQTNGLNEELKDAAEEVVVDKENDDSNQGISSSEIVNKVDYKKVETVHTIALLEKSPSNTLMEDYLQSLN